MPSNRDFSDEREAHANRILERADRLDPSRANREPAHPLPVNRTVEKSAPVARPVANGTDERPIEQPPR